MDKVLILAITKVTNIHCNETDTKCRKAVNWYLVYI